MNEPLKEKDVIRGVIVNADEYKSDDIISPDKIVERWINLDNLSSAVEWLLQELDKIEDNGEAGYGPDRLNPTETYELIKKAFIKTFPKTRRRYKEVVYQNGYKRRIYFNEPPFGKRDVLRLK